MRDERALLVFIFSLVACVYFLRHFIFFQLFAPKRRFHFSVSGSNLGRPTALPNLYSLWSLNFRSHHEEYFHFYLLAVVEIRSHIFIKFCNI